MHQRRGLSSSSPVKKRPFIIFQQRQKMCIFQFLPSFKDAKMLMIFMLCILPKMAEKFSGFRSKKNSGTCLSQQMLQCSMASLRVLARATRPNRVLGNLKWVHQSVSTLKEKLSPLPDQKASLDKMAFATHVQTQNLFFVDVIHVVFTNLEDTQSVRKQFYQWRSSAEKKQAQLVGLTYVTLFCKEQRKQESTVKREPSLLEEEEEQKCMLSHTEKKALIGGLFFNKVWVVIKAVSLPCHLFSLTSNDFSGEAC